MSQQHTLLLFTDSYPYTGSQEQTFLDPEIPVLARNFKQIILVPQQLHGQLLEVPTNVRIDDSLAHALNNLPAKVPLVFSQFGLRQLGNELRLQGFRLLHPSAFYRFWSFVSKARIFNNWLSRLIVNTKADPKDMICYTYWLGPACLGIGLLKKQHPEIKIVSRAHSADLYEERYNPPYLPCRQSLLMDLDLLLPDSLAGERYIVNRYSWFAPRCRSARQGVGDPGFLTRPSVDGCFRLVSCSFLIRRKRVDLVLKGLAIAANLRPERKFEWDHIGDGELKSELLSLAADKLPINVSFKVHGYLAPSEMMAFYAKNPIDLFINTSSNEGTPVSLMEVASCGIPIVATAVGGNTEIVSDLNGLILSAHPMPEEVASAILWFVDNPNLAETKRLESRQVWVASYNSAVNFQDFADTLKSLRNS